jgi:hypothetical protein
MLFELESMIGSTKGGSTKGGSIDTVGGSGGGAADDDADAIGS